GAQGKTLRLLLVDPYSAFANARSRLLGQATGPGQDPLPARREVNNELVRAQSGMVKVLQGLLGLPEARDAIPEDESDSINTWSYTRLLEALQRVCERAPVEVQFYDVAPSGPMIFLNDILVRGTFPFRRSSLNMPWTMIVRAPALEEDRFQIFQTEFDEIWADKAHSWSISDQIAKARAKDAEAVPHSYFLSYSHVQEEVVDHIEALLLRQGKKVIRDEVEVSVGDPVRRKSADMVQNSDTVVALFSEDYAKSTHAWTKLE
ncbi:MAG: toll/interleukin-1 receptor domain-containing protein, partial [Pseudomonadota bacterium]